jgi:glucokinase
MGKRDTPKYRLGIDLGGTKIYAVVIDRKGRVLGKARRPTRAEQGYRKVLGQVGDIAREATDDAGIGYKSIDSIGLGIPGPVDSDQGVVVVAPNLGWRGLPVARDAARALKRPVVLGNDVNFGGLGEVAYGVARKAESSFAAFVGTGLGGALTLDGAIVNGAHGFAGELGHVPAPFGAARCGCGRVGCLETVASKTGIARLVAGYRRQGVRCLLTSERGRLRSSDLLRAWQAGCPATRKAVAESARALGWGLAVVSMSFDPEVFVLGGGVIEALSRQMLPLVRQALVEHSMLYRRRKPDLRLAALGDDAGAIGAAVASTGKATEG